MSEQSDHDLRLSDQSELAYEGIDPEDAGKHLTLDLPDSNVRRAMNVEDVPELAVTDEMLRKDGDSPNSWLQYNKGLGQQGYTPAETITPENVGSLERAYTLDGLTPSIRSNPIVVPSDPPVLYFTESDLTVHALDARTGEEFWSFQPKLADSPGGLQGWNTGVAAYGDKVYLATWDPDLVALNRYTGKQQWRTHMVTEKQQEAAQSDAISCTQTPTVYDGKVFVGQSGDFGGYGAVNAFDAETGEVAWHGKTLDREKWIGDSWHFGSNCAWRSAAIDPESETVVWAVGNSNPMMNPTPRPGPNPHSNSIMAFDLTNGDLKWANQYLPGGVWDYDAHTSPAIFEMKVDGEKRTVVSHDGKDAWTYVFDLETGQLLERTRPFARQDHSAFGEANRSFLALPPAAPPETPDDLLKGDDPVTDLGPQEAPAGYPYNRKPMWPGISGGTEWPADAYSRKTGLRYVGANHMAQDVHYWPGWKYDSESIYNLIGGEWYPPEELGDGIEHWTSVTAVDPASGEVVWKTKLEDLPPTTPHQGGFAGGTTATGGNVVFHGSSAGYLVAFDAESGDRLWRDNVGGHVTGRVTSSPVVWEDPQDGNAYVGVTANDKLVVYSLD